jgi:hypothetical protein
LLPQKLYARHPGGGRLAQPKAQVIRLVRERAQRQGGTIQHKIFHP